MQRILRNLAVDDSRNSGNPPELRGSVEAGTRPPRTARRFVSIMTVDSLTVAPLPDVGDVLLGRGPHVDVRIPDRAAGARHARLIVQEAAFFVVDLGSGAGTSIGGVPLLPNVPTAVHPGEGILIGETVLMVREVLSEERPRSIWSHGAFATRLDEECERACRSGAEFSLLRLRLGGDGLMAGETAVLAALALMAPAPHVVGWYGNNEYEVLLVGDSSARAQDKLRGLSHSLAASAIDVRGGLVHFPVDGRDGDVLIAGANQRLFGATEPRDRSDGTDDTDFCASLQEAVQSAAAHEGPVCLVGERGVGKETVARAIHKASQRCHGPFRVIELKGRTSGELDAELFGSKRGARGALHDFREGTLFLAGSESLSRGLALRIAFALRSKASPERPGAGPRLIIGTDRTPNAPRPVHRRGQLAEVVGADMVHVPPLRDRHDDLPGLIERMIRDSSNVRGCVARISADQILAWCCRPDWPGNLRELKNEVDRAVAGAVGQPGAGAVAEVITQRVELPPGVERGERDRILNALLACAFNQSRAASLLGISRRTLVTRLDQLGIGRPQKSVTPRPVVPPLKGL